MSAYFEIPFLYDQAMKAKTDGDLIKAANLFIECNNLYECAELNVFCDEVKQKGGDAINQYHQIASKYDDDSEFDNIIYGS